jgi:hypothetical protein
MHDRILEEAADRTLVRPLISGTKHQEAAAVGAAIAHGSARFGRIDCSERLQAQWHGADTRRHLGHANTLGQGQQ